MNKYKYRTELQNGKWTFHRPPACGLRIGEWICSICWFIEADCIMCLVWMVTHWWPWNTALNLRSEKYWRSDGPGTAVRRCQWNSLSNPKLIDAVNEWSSTTTCFRAKQETDTVCNWHLALDISQNAVAHCTTYCFSSAIGQENTKRKSFGGMNCGLSN